MHIPQQKAICRRYDEFRRHGLAHRPTIYLLQLMYELTSRGFEEYVRRYFYRVYQIRAQVTGGIHDKGVDIIGSYKQKPFFIQCKKRSSRHIKIAQILEFWHYVHHHPQHTEHTIPILITTNRISKPAKLVAEQYKISIRDYSHLLKRSKQYSFQHFAKELGRNTHDLVYYKNNYFTPYSISHIIDTHLLRKPKQLFLLEK